MKKKEKGFTLVELIAVIVILGVIVTIAVPSISNLIKKGRKDSLFASANGLYDSAKAYYADYVMNNGEVTENFTFDVTKESDIKTLSFKGEIPDSGFVYISKEGNVGIVVSSGNYCAYKEMDESEINVKEGNDCSITNMGD